MGCKTVGKFTFDNATPEAVEAGANVPLPEQIVSNSCLSCDGSNITINRAGLYSVEVNLTLVGSAADNLETQMYRNGNAVPGAHAISTFSGADAYATQAYSVPITVSPAVPQATINVKPSSAASVRIANVTVTKMA